MLGKWPSAFLMTPEGSMTETGHRRKSSKDVNTFLHILAEMPSLSVCLTVHPTVSTVSLGLLLIVWLSQYWSASISDCVCLNMTNNLSVSVQSSPICESFSTWLWLSACLSPSMCALSPCPSLLVYLSLSDCVCLSPSPSALKDLHTFILYVHTVPGLFSHSWSHFEAKIWLFVDA